MAEGKRMEVAAMTKVMLKNETERIFKGIEKNKKKKSVCSGLLLRVNVCVSVRG